MNTDHLTTLSKQLAGELKFDTLSKALYATDASVYRKIPTAVSFPKSEADLIKLIAFATDHEIGLIPRAAGTSLAGQCVGSGIVVDVSRHFTKILNLDTTKKQVTVQPGVIRDNLNRYLKPHGLFFGPNTSTSNRCMIGGMVGNNSSGTTSIQYGVTRDKVVALKVLLSDGSTATISPLNTKAFEAKCKEQTLEGKIYKQLWDELSDQEQSDRILKEFPKPSIHRRNTGYAIDLLLDNAVFGNSSAPFDLSKLLCGSEGTLALTTEITLQLDDLPPAFSAMVATHYSTLEACLKDVSQTMKHNLFTCEMMDKVILDCTKNNRQQLANRFFIEGDPAAILMLEVRAHSEEALEEQLHLLQKTIKKSGLSYARPVLKGNQIQQALELRKAGLGLLGNMVGDKKAVACIEDTAVALEDLSDFILEFTEIMKGYGQQAVYYAHAGAGELHLRPILNLKKKADVKLFRAITTDVARLTKKYRGSFSGEHGDGIVRAEFIPIMIGQENYDMLRRVKSTFDPGNLFNPGKIVDPFPMDESFRYDVGRIEPKINTLLDFSKDEGLLKSAEKCNGSGDCRKTHEFSGAMCPSYHATLNETHTTRGRANALREFLTQSEKQNPFDHKELKEVFDLCLSCKACASECPSSVDVASYKAEFQYQYQETNGYPLRNRLFAHSTKLNSLGSRMPWLVNALYNFKFSGALIKRTFGIAKNRSLPNIYSFNFNKYLLNTVSQLNNDKSIILYIDEFTQYLDVEVGQDAIALLKGLGYQVELFYGESGRSHISKGFLKQAKQLANENIKALHKAIDAQTPIIGLEPSAILSFRDEYVKLAESKDRAEKLKEQSFLIEEFLSKEIENGALTADMFGDAPREIKIHNHCYQKALSNQKVTFDILNLPKNHKVSIISSGCCGMAGSFGYEKEHYDVSMQIGELKLFPAVRKCSGETTISANGTSCRHQIFDGTGTKALHPVTILRQALLVK
ncbi:MAG: FAD-binding oxidoreductase [Allomuricauda sp.]|nr:MAG: FAD-binding oxidoreductase [Allomuricauda sp.]